jgi:hypothetical protein
MHPPARRSRWIVAPLLIVILLALAWSGLWLWASRVADAQIAAWIEREAAVGRVYNCASRTIGGYPFRIELRCTEPAVELRGQGTPVTIKAREILAVAQVYQPTLIIAEVTGPMTVADASGALSLTADWTLLQASVRGLPATPERISLVFDAPKLRRTGESDADALIQADRIEFHVRQGADFRADAPLFDLGSRLSNAVIPSVPGFSARPFNAEAAAVLRGLRDLIPKPVALRLREWQAAGGRLEIANARMQQGEALATAKGDVGLSANGRLDGNLTLALAGFEDLARLIGLPNIQIRGGQGGLLGNLSAMLGGGQTEIDGKKAMTVPLRFNDGAVFFGPLRVGQTPAWF